MVRNTQLITALLKQITDCYALPAATRVTNADPKSTDPIETAADVVAPACKNIFVNNDPSRFLGGGRKVASNGAFSSLFRSGADGLVFDRGTYEFTRVNNLSTNGDVIIGYRATDKDGNVTYDTLAVRADNATTPTKYQVIGNQYDYDGGVNPNQQLRSFLKNSANDYFSTGYVLSVRDNGNFNKVIVSTPSGEQFILKPRVGFDLLQLVKIDATGKETITGTTFVRVQSKYVDPMKDGNDPSTADLGVYFSAKKSLDADITGAAEQSVWTFDYYLNSAPTVAVTQKYRTRARALSIGELKQKILPNLPSGDITDTVNLLGANNSFPAPTTAPIMINWLVPEGGIAPTTIGVFGSVFDPATKMPVSGFNDTARVGSSKRLGSIFCLSKGTVNGVADNHCVGNNYSVNSRISGISLVGNESTGREFVHFYATYTIQPTATGSASTASAPVTAPVMP